MKTNQLQSAGPAYNSYKWLFSGLLLARIATLPLSSFSLNGGFVEAWSALRARGMEWFVPQVFGAADWNTPPLHTWILALFGNVFGWSEIALRLPSTIAWALAAIPVARMSKNKILAAGLWLVLPIPMYMAGRAAPDMLLVLFVALFVAAYRRDEPLAMFGWFVLGTLTKPVMVLVLVPLLFDREYRAFVLPIISVSLVVIVPFTIQHIMARGFGYWDVFGLVRAFVAGSAGLVIVCLRRDWRAYWMLPFVAFYLYAAPPFHEYYLLPVFPFVASLTADMIPDRKHAKAALIISVLGSGLLLGVSGSLHDTRTRDMATGEPPMVAQNALHAIAAWYYYTPIDTWDGSASGKVWSVTKPCANSTLYPGFGMDLYVGYC